MNLSRLLNNNLLRDSFWALLGNFLGKGLVLIAGIVVARFLGNESYGEYGMIRNNLTMIAIFSSLGLGYTATKFIAEGKIHNPEQIYQTHKVVTHITCFFSSFIAFVVFIFAEPIASWLEANELCYLLRLSAIAIVFNAINATQIGELAGLSAYKDIARNNVVAGFVTFLISVISTYLYNIDGAVFALVISLFANCLLNRLSLSKYLKCIKIIRAQISDYKKIISFSLPIALQESTYSVTHWLNTIILIKLAGYGELGIYSVATQWMAVMLFIPGALRNVALSHLSSNNDDVQKNKKMLMQLIFVNVLGTVIPFLIIALLSEWICSWYGSSYYGLQRVLNICMFTTIINSLTNVFTQNLISLNQNWFVTITQWVRDLSILLCAYLFIPLLENGALVMAVITLISQSVYLCLLLYKQYSLYSKLSVLI